MAARGTASASTSRGQGEHWPSPYLTKEQIEMSPSRAYFLRKHGSVEAAREKEHAMRIRTCAFLQESGQRLRLPQLSIATAIIFFHRFYARMSYEHYDRFTVATTCLFLASKVEETPKKLKDVVIETFKSHHQTDKAPEPDSKDFFELKEKILVCERILLQALGFDLSVEHAYRPLLAYVKSIKGTRDLAQVAWNFINDSLRTTICLQYAPRLLAAAATQLAAKYLTTHTKKDFQLPEAGPGKKWWHAFQATEEDINDISQQILDMYAEKPGQPGGAAGFLNGASLSLMTDTLKSHARGDHVASTAAAPADAPAATPATAAPATAAPAPPTDSSTSAETASRKADSADSGVANEGAAAAQEADATVKPESGGAAAADSVPLDAAAGCKRDVAAVTAVGRTEAADGQEVKGEDLPDAKRSRPSDP